jgi:hypothetical protein
MCTNLLVLSVLWTKQLPDPFKVCTHCSEPEFH